MAAKRIDGLDAIRGICAIAVVAMHSRFLTQIDPAPSAYLMVDIFFAMSGYVMAMVYGERLRGGGYFLAFVERRWTRLVPMWAVGLAVGALTALVFQRHHWPALLSPIFSFAAGLVFFPVPVAPDLFPYNSPGWSLFYEALANLAFALSAPLLSRKTLSAVILIAAAALIALVVHYGSAGGGRTWSEAPVALARVAFSFSVGLLFYQERARFASVRIPPALFWTAMIAIGLVAAANPHGNARVLFDLGFILIGCPLVLLLGVRAVVGAPGLARLLGDISYPLYATHFAFMLTIFFLHGALLHWRTNVVSLPIALAAIVALIGLAWILARFIDRPIEERLRRLLGRTPVHFRGPENPSSAPNDISGV